jgi:hypothetical protein
MERVRDALAWRVRPVEERSDTCHVRFYMADLWKFLAPADRETFLSGCIAWLMDPEGSHGLGRAVLDRFLCPERINVALDPGSATEIVPEDLGGRRKRFDIAVKQGGQPRVVLEVKCKTTGSSAQLETYRQEGARVARIAFGEYNFPDLNDAQRRDFPFISIQEVAEWLRELAPQAAIGYPGSSTLGSGSSRNDIAASFTSKLRATRTGRAWRQMIPPRSSVAFS